MYGPIREVRVVHLSFSWEQIAVSRRQHQHAPANDNYPSNHVLDRTIVGHGILLRIEALCVKYILPIEVKGLPKGVTASKAEIPAEEDSTVVVLYAAADLPLNFPPAHIEILGYAKVNGREITRRANVDNPLQVASIIPPPDVVVRAEPAQVAIMPEKEVTVSLHVERRNGFKGRVPCDVVNLPPGVRVVNIGLNGVLVAEDQTDVTFKLRAADWAKPLVQPIYVVARVESNATTLHPSPPILLRVEGKGEGSNAVAAIGVKTKQPRGSSAANARPRP